MWEHSEVKYSLGMLHCFENFIPRDTERHIEQCPSMDELYSQVEVKVRLENSIRVSLRDARIRIQAQRKGC